MMERDYLMRQIMQLFQALQKIMRHRKKGENEEALEEISYFYSSLKIDDDVSTMSIEQLIHLLVDEKKLPNDHLEMVAYVLKEQGEMAGEENARVDYFRKAFFLLNKIERESITFSMDRLMKLEELKEYL